MLTWYYRTIVTGFLTIWRSLFIIVTQEFSLFQLVKTLFSPWRRDLAPLTGSLDVILKRVLENVISRAIGFLVRFFAISACLIFEAFLGLLGSAIFILVLIFSPLGLLFAWPKFSEQSDIFEPEARKILNQGQNPGHLFNLILENQRTIFILNHLGISDQSLKNLVPESGLTIKQITSLATTLGREAQKPKSSVPELFLAFYLSNPNLKKTLENFGFQENDLRNVYEWENALNQAIHPPFMLLHPELIRTSGGIGRLWSSGYTPNLDLFTYDLSLRASRSNPLHFEAHKKEIDDMERILANPGKHNLILVGDPGVGKKTLVFGFARRIVLGETVLGIAHQRVVELSIKSLVAGAKTIGELEERLVRILNEGVRAGNIILFVDNLAELFEPRGSRAGVVDASALLIPYMERPDFQLIGTTDFADYHRFIETNAQLAKNFEKIEIQAPNAEETLKIIERTALYLEGRHKILILYSALKEIVRLSERYLSERRFPESAIDLLDECAVQTISQKEKILTKEIAEQVVAIKTKIPAGTVAAPEREKLLNLEERLHQRLINQEEAVSAIASALRRARAGLAKPNRPLGSFLFLGPTGTGKTEVAKTLAEAYFGNENRLMRFDMTEYREAGSIGRLIGDQLGNQGILTSKIREQPFSLILLDEIEKAHPNVLNLFLQVIDEGRLTDSLGRPVDFRNSLIIATSNAGSEWIRERVNRGEEIDRSSLLDYLFNQGYFRPEFFNRFDAAVAFRPLTMEELEKVVDLMIGRLEKQLKKKQIKIELGEGARRKLAEIGFDPQFGARALQRVIQEKVENRIAEKILAGRLPLGSTYTISGDL